MSDLIKQYIKVYKIDIIKRNRRKQGSGDEWWQERKLANIKIRGSRFMDKVKEYWGEVKIEQKDLN